MAAQAEELLMILSLKDQMSKDLKNATDSLNKMKKTLDVDTKATKDANSMWKNAGRPNMVLETPNRLGRAGRHHGPTPDRPTGRPSRAAPAAEPSAATEPDSKWAWRQPGTPSRLRVKLGPWASESGPVTRAA